MLAGILAVGSSVRILNTSSAIEVYNLLPFSPELGSAILSGRVDYARALDPSGSTRRRDDDQERHDWAQWDESRKDRPHRPSPSAAHWRIPLAS
jgi:hypothetical protein